MYQTVMAVLLALVVGFFIGNDIGKEDIAKKCELRGAFVKGTKAFTCEPIIINITK